MPPPLCCDDTHKRGIGDGGICCKLWMLSHETVEIHNHCWGWWWGCVLRSPVSVFSFRHCEFFVWSFVVVKFFFIVCFLNSHRWRQFIANILLLLLLICRCVGVGLESLAVVVDFWNYANRSALLNYLVFILNSNKLIYLTLEQNIYNWW